MLLKVFRGLAPAIKALLVCSALHNVCMSAAAEQILCYISKRAGSPLGHPVLCWVLGTTWNQHPAQHVVTGELCLDAVELQAPLLKLRRARLSS